MNRFRGLQVASFIVGVVAPIIIVCNAISYLRDAKEIQETVEVQTIEIPASTVEMFYVDYDEYGSYTLGDEFIKCTIVNNVLNSLDCTVYLKDAESVITERVDLTPSRRVLVMKTTWSTEIIGEYPVTLVYEVQTDDGLSTIECPFKILANKAR